MKFFSQLKEAVFEQFFGDKGAPVKGQFWWDTQVDEPKCYSGTQVKVFVVTDDTAKLPLGEQATDGSWRITIVGSEIQFQRLVLGVWENKGAFS